MPAALDLTGRRVGRLVVLRLDGMINYDLVQRAWRCRCDCGTEITVPRSLLTAKSYRIDAYPACRARRCVICSGPVITTNSRAITCSPACREDNRSIKMRASAAQWRSNNPDAAREQQKRYRERRSADRGRYDRWIEWKRDYWRRNRETILALRRALRDAMSPDEREQHRQRLREYHRVYMQHHLAVIRSDPERRRALLDLTVDWRRRRALAAITAIGAELESKL